MSAHNLTFEDWDQFVANAPPNQPEFESVQALWYIAPESAELRLEELPACPKEALLIRSKFGALSRGTESLVFRGLVPESEYQRMRAPFMEGSFPFPVKYGYANVGQVELGPPALIGKMVFGLMPHQSRYHANPQDVFVLPDGVSPERAVLAANMETALNAVWDGAVGPGDTIAVVGGGVLGCLVAYLCAHLPGAKVTLVDINPERAHIAQALGVQFALPESAPIDCDVVFHCSASATGLASAIACAGEEATVLELSWYGSTPIAAPLGGAFHSRQIRLQSSQVGHISASRRPRWTYHRRLSAALELLVDARLDCLLSAPIDFDALPKQLPELLGSHSSELCCLIRYP